MLRIASFTVFVLSRFIETWYQLLVCICGSEFFPALVQNIEFWCHELYCILSLKVGFVV